MRKYNFHDACTKWILVEEMLPKMPGRYLVTVEIYKNGTITHIANFQNGIFDKKNVIAWRQVPLPYPYKR